MTPEEKLAAVTFWQREASFHPLTCGNDSNHAELRGKEIDGDVILYCPTCDYTQEWVPEYVYEAYAYFVNIGMGFIGDKGGME